MKTNALGYGFPVFEELGLAEDSGLLGPFEPPKPGSRL